MLLFILVFAQNSSFLNKKKWLQNVAYKMLQDIIFHFDNVLRNNRPLGSEVAAGSATKTCSGQWVGGPVLKMLKGVSPRRRTTCLFYQPWPHTSPVHGHTRTLPRRIIRPATTPLCQYNTLSSAGLRLFRKHL